MKLSKAGCSPIAPNRERVGGDCWVGWGGGGCVMVWTPWWMDEEGGSCFISSRGS